MLDDPTELIAQCRRTGDPAALAPAVPAWFDADLLAALLGPGTEATCAELIASARSGQSALLAAQEPSPLPSATVYAVAPAAREALLDALDTHFPKQNHLYYARAFAWFAATQRTLAGPHRAAAAAEAMRLLDELFYLCVDNHTLDTLAGALAAARGADFADPLHLQTIRYYGAVLHNERHQYAAAEAELTALLDEVQNETLAARAYTALGVLYDYLQRFEDAIAAYTSSARLYRNLGRPAGEARALNNLGIVYHQLAEYEQARPLFEQAHAMAGNLDDPVLSGRCLMELGYTDKQLGRWEAAIDHYRQSLHIWEQKQNEDYQARLHNNLGEVFLLTAEWEQADAHFATAHALYLAIPQADRNPRELADITHNRALLALAQGQDHAAEAQLEAARALAGDAGDATATARARHSLGRLAQRRGDLAGARTHYAAAIAQLEAIGGQIDVPEVRASYRATQQRTYEDMVLLCLEAGDPHAALDYVEQAKARVLLDAMHTAQLADDLQRRPPLTAAEIQAQLPPQTALAVYFGTGQTGPAEMMLQRLPPAAASLRALLLPPECLLVFVVTCDRIVPLALPTTLTRIERRYLMPASGQLVGLGPDSSGRLRPPHRWHALHAELVAPLLPHLGECRHLIFVPHGSLHYLPLHALGEPGRLLQDQGISVTYAPSGSILFRTGFPHRTARDTGNSDTGNSDTGKWAPRGLAVGVNLDGLTHAETEAAWVAELLAALGGGGGGRLLQGGDATVAAVKAQMAQAQVLHLACHGHFQRVVPMQSGLQLLDGRLTAAEILPLRLDADLAALSACDTGLNKLTHGDELFGLTRAFFAAGVRALLVTLWPVSDLAARLFMDSFYRAWIEQGEPFSAALATAQNALRTMDYPALHQRMEALGMAAADSQRQAAELRSLWEGEHPFQHPFYWGAFVLTGNPG